LQHYLFPAGGEGIYLVVNERGEFKEDTFNKAMSTIQENMGEDPADPKSGKGRKGKTKKGGSDKKGECRRGLRGNIFNTKFRVHRFIQNYQDDHDEELQSGHYILL
jgi:superfamily II RNA helicase